MDDMIYETLDVSEDVTCGAATARKNPFCVISKAAFGQYGVHDIQTNSGWTANPYGEDYAVVPDDMVAGILATGGFCALEFSEDGRSVTGFTALEAPEIPEVEAVPTAVEQLRADVDYIAIMTGVEL